MPRPFILNNKFEDSAFFATAFRLFIDVNSAYGEFEAEIERFSTLNEALAERIASEPTVDPIDDIVELVVGDIRDARDLRADEGILKIPDESRPRSCAVFPGER